MPRSILGPPLVLLLAAPGAPALASEDLAGTYIHIYYSDAGICYDSEEKAGIQVNFEGTPYEWTYASTTIQPLLGSALQYTSAGEILPFEGYYDDTGYSVDWTTTGEEDTSAGSVHQARYTWEMGDLSVVKTETWDDDAMALFVKFEVMNIGTEDLEDFTYAHVIDPVDSGSGTRSSNTRNDLVDVDGDGYSDWAQAQGRAATTTNDKTMGFGLCDPGRQQVGFNAGTEVSVSAITLEGDTEGLTANYQLVFQNVASEIVVGDTIMFGFIMAFGATDTDAQGFFADALPYCYDLDEDGFENELGDGRDCDDEDAGINPRADEIYYDGIDTDCGEDDDYDQDGDGFVPDEYEGLPTTDANGNEIRGTGDAEGGDCDDTDEDINPDVEETWYNGVDENCDEADDYDQDGDGFVPDEYEGQPTYSPDGEEIDGTGDADGGDCDDEDDTIYPGAEDVWYDGIDSDCAGNNDFDRDGDGSESDEYGGDDCDDTEEGINPDAEETWYNGIDEDCGEDDDYDQDGDGYVEDENEGLTTTNADGDTIDGTGELPPGDCDDEDPDITTCAAEVPYYKGGGGCVCASGGSPAAAAGWLSLLVGLGLLRRRRQN